MAVWTDEHDRPSRDRVKWTPTDFDLASSEPADGGRIGGEQGSRPKTRHGHSGARPADGERLIAVGP